MKKTFCDMCEKETENPRVVTIDMCYNRPTIIGATPDFTGVSYDICETCRRKILVILGKEDENSNEKT